MTLASAVCSTRAGGSASQARDELCNNLDDDCDGETDELTDAGDTHDLTRDDSRIGAACDVPTPPANLDPCKAGTNICDGGSL